VSFQANSLDGKPLTFVAASGQLQPQGDRDAIDMTFLPGKPGEGTARAVVPSAGTWTLTVHIVTDATTDYAAATTYTVR
jgi:hypothetical protein